MPLLYALLALGLVVNEAQAALRSRAFYWSDDYTHLLISRQALHHPELLLSVWGRPLMTGLYLPAAAIGDIAVRVTSLAILYATAAAVFGAARRTGRLIWAPSAALLLLAQPSAARLGYAALPATVFSLVLAVAFWLRASDRHSLAAAVLSFLPLARLEGLVVIALWGLFLWHERRWRSMPWLAVGVAVWAIASALYFGDPLALWHQNPYHVTETVFPHAALAYVPRALPVAAGSVVVALAVFGMISRGQDRLCSAVLVCLAAFYGVVWHRGSALADPSYLVALSVPMALLASSGLSGLASGERESGVSKAVLLLVLAGLTRSKVAIILVAGLVAVDRLRLGHWLAQWSSRLGSAQDWHRALGSVVLALAVVMGGANTTPLSRSGAPRLAAELAPVLRGRTVDFCCTNSPEFAWLTRDWLEGRSLRGENVGLVIRSLKPGSLVVWDDQLALSKPGHPERPPFMAWGFRPVRTAREQRRELVLWERR